MEEAKLVVVTTPAAKWYVRLKLFFIYWRILPKWVGSKIEAEKYIALMDKKAPSGIYIDIEKLR